MLGVGHDANTTLHLAEMLAEVPYRRRKHITVLRDARPQRLEYGENDHCCQRFNLVDGWLQAGHLQSVGPVGNATARLLRSRDVIDVVVPRLRRDPFVFLHPRGSGCAECDDAWSSIAS